MLTLYGAPNTRSTRVAWALEEAGAEWSYRLVDLTKGGGRAPEFLALNPGGKVPVLIDDGLVLTESAAICTWIAERHPAARLIPAAGTEARARYDEAVTFVVTELEQPLWSIGKHTFALPPKLRVPAMLEVAPKEFARAADVLARRLGDRPYVLGDDFTMADVLTGHTLAWARAFGQSVTAPNLVDYAERVLSRPAVARAMGREAAGA